MAGAAEGNARQRFGLGANSRLGGDLRHHSLRGPDAADLGIRRRRSRFRVRRAHCLDEHPRRRRQPRHGAAVLAFFAAAGRQFRIGVGRQYRYDQRAAEQNQQKNGRNPPHSGIITISRHRVKLLAQSNSGEAASANFAPGLMFRGRRSLPWWSYQATRAK